MSTRTKDVVTAEKVLEQIFADEDYEEPGNSSDSSDSEEAEEESSADNAEFYAESGESSELGHPNFLDITDNW